MIFMLLLALMVSYYLAPTCFRVLVIVCAIVLLTLAATAFVTLTFISRML